eukprot:2773845-Rhodomonas_salina.1
MVVLSLGAGNFPISIDTANQDMDWGIKDWVRAWNMCSGVLLGTVYLRSDDGRRFAVWRAAAPVCSLTREHAKAKLLKAKPRAHKRRAFCDAFRVDGRIERIRVLTYTESGRYMLNSPQGDFTPEHRYHRIDPTLESYVELDDVPAPRKNNTHATRAQRMASVSKHARAIARREPIDARAPSLPVHARRCQPSLAVVQHVSRCLQRADKRSFGWDA